MTLEPLLQASPEIVSGCAKRLPELTRVFRDVSRVKDLCRPYQCEINVKNLFREFKKAMPDLSEDDFKVIIITWPREQKVGYRLNNPRRLESGGRPGYKGVDGYGFHVVLYFYGFIFDLDNSDVPHLVTVSEYLASQFYKKLERRLVAYVVPGSIYFPKVLSGETGYKYQQSLYSGIEPIRLNNLATTLRKL